MPGFWSKDRAFHANRASPYRRIGTDTFMVDVTLRCVVPNASTMDDAELRVVTAFWQISTVCAVTINKVALREPETQRRYRPKSQ
jgi:hypothetical protein